MGIEYIGITDVLITGIIIADKINYKKTKWKKI
jgi:hypothetical protein